MFETDISPVGLLLVGAVGGALAAGAIAAVVLRVTARDKTLERDETSGVEMLGLDNTQEDSSLDEPFLGHEQARGAATAGDPSHDQEEKGF